MKKNFKKIAVLIIIALMIALLPVNVHAQAAKKPKISKKSLNIEPGKSKKIKLKANGNEILSIKWSSSDKYIAKPSKKKTMSTTIKGLHEGECLIFAEVETPTRSYKLMCNVYVEEGE